MTGIKMGFEVSKEAVKLVRTGKAIYSSGGVRLLDGTLFELAKPVVQTAGSSSPLSPLTLVSSLGNNVQSVFIQKGVNKANRGIKVLKKQGVEIIKDMDLIHADTIEIKQGMISMMDELYGVNQGVDLLNSKADISLLKMNQLQNMVSGLTTLTWLNCAFSIMNMGISIVGFSQVLGKLSSISDQISALEYKIGWNLMNEYRQQFDYYCNQIRTDIQALQNYEQKASKMHSIPEHLNKIQAFLNRVYIDFLAGNINNELACNIIFGLTNAFAQEVQFYSTRYQYEKGELPAAYDSWVKTITTMSQSDFLSKLETALTLEYMDFSLKQQKDILDASVLTSRLQLDNLVFSNLLTDAIPEEEFLNIDLYLARIASSPNNIQETENGVMLMIA